MTVTLATAVAGLIAGLGIGGLGAGLVVVFRASRVVNLAHAELGAAGAALCAWLVGHGRLPFPAAAGVAVAGAAVTGALIEVVVVRRLQAGSPAAVMIATAGLGEVFLALSLVLGAGVRSRVGYPVPFTARLDLGRGVVLRGSDISLVIAVPVLAVALALVLQRSRLGSALRAASDNPEAARLAGLPVGALAALAWAAAAALSAVVVICLLAGRPAVGSDALGPEVLFESLAAAVLARFRHPSWALVAGLGIGVAVQVVGYNWPGGMSDVVLFVVVAVGAVLVWRPWSARDGRRDDRRPWLAVPVLPARRAGSLLGRGVVLGAALLAVAAGLGAGLASNSQALTLTEIAAYATLAISVTLMVGVAGQLTLGQVALFGVGAAVSYQLAVAANLPFWLAFLGAGVAAAAAAVVVGLPALQGPGPVFAVTSLGFALVAAGWLLTRSWLIGAGVTIPRPILGPIDLGPQRPYLVFSVVVLAAALAVVQVLLRRGPGRRMVAVRDNEAAAASFGIPAAATTLLAFAVAGFLAGIAGAVYGHGLQAVSVNDFPVASPGLQIGAVDSLRIVAIAVIGGLGSPAGAIAGAALVVGADELTHSVALRLATSGAGLVVVLMLAPRGLAGIWGSPGWARRSWHGVRGRLAAGRAGRRAAQ